MIAHGATGTLAAKRVGVGTTTIRNWILRGARDIQSGKDSIYRTFKEAVDFAEAQQAARMLNNIEQAATRDWKASAWMLERRHGYTRPPHVERKESITEEEMAFLASLETTDD